MLFVSLKEQEVCALGKFELLKDFLVGNEMNKIHSSFLCLH